MHDPCCLLPAPPPPSRSPRHSARSATPPRAAAVDARDGRRWPAAAIPAPHLAPSAMRAPTSHAVGVCVWGGGCQFEDCTPPPTEVVSHFMRIVDRAPGLIAVHCKAGLGRTGTLIALYLMLAHRFAARDAMAWLRIVRPGRSGPVPAEQASPVSRPGREATPPASRPGQECTPPASRPGQEGPSLARPGREGRRESPAPGWAPVIRPNLPPTPPARPGLRFHLAGVIFGPYLPFPFPIFRSCLPTAPFSPPPGLSLSAGSYDRTAGRVAGRSAVQGRPAIRPPRRRWARLRRRTALLSTPPCLGRVPGPGLVATLQGVGCR